MNIIFLALEVPYPPNTGARIYTWERLKQLKKFNCNVNLFSLVEKDEKINEEELLKVCKGVKVYRRANKYAKGLKYFNRPFTVSTRYVKDMCEDIRNIIKDNRVDLIIVDSPLILMNCPFDNSIPKILTQHNIEYRLFETVYKNSNNIIRKLAFWKEFIQMKKFEESFYNKKLIDGYVFISKVDKQFFENLYGLKNSICIPPGYDISIQNKKQIEPYAIVFTGKMDYDPNVQAVQWFVKDIFPQIKSHIKEAKFYIVGKNPVPSVKELEKNPGVIVTGMVDSVEEYLQKGHLYVVPLLSGGGVKLKLFEAIGNKNIVISTSKGIEGTDFKNNEHLIIKDNAEEFAEQCINIMTKTDEFYYLADNGIELLQEQYSWDSIGNKYYEYLSKLSKDNL